MDMLKPLIALLAIVNPIGAIPFFLHFTQNLSDAQCRRTIRVASITSFMVIAVSAIAGLQIIEFFGITIASFQVGGGLLLLISSLNMLNAQQAESRGSDVGDGQAKADAGDSVAVVPLTIPLLTGPATISTMVIYAEKTRTLAEHAVLVGYGVVVHGLVDNLLRPILVGKDARMPDYVVMITTLGGMAVFGINGFIIGPTIAAMFIAVWHLSIAAPSRPR